MSDDVQAPETVDDLLKKITKRLGKSQKNSSKINFLYARYIGENVRVFYKEPSEDPFSECLYIEITPKRTIDNKAWVFETMVQKVSFPAVKTVDPPEEGILLTVEDVIAYLKKYFGFACESA